MDRQRGALTALFIVCAVASNASAQSRPEITISEPGVLPENLTSSQNGSIYFGSTAKGTIYRASPGAAVADPWILASSANLTNVLGVLADDKSNTLWVCQNSTGGRNGAPVVGQTALRSFDLNSGAAKATYPLPANAGICNDIAVATDGSAYVAESFRGRVHRLRPGGTALEIWFTDSASINAVDGLSLLADGSLYVNDFFNGKLFRIPVNPDGSAGALVTIEASLPSRRPDGLRAAGPRTLLQAEGQGRVTELTISGNRAEVRVLQDGLTGATGVTLLGDTAFVLMGRSKAVAVPYRRR